MNLTVVVGTLGSDPVIKNTEGNFVVYFSLYDNHIRSEAEKILYRCKMEGKLAEATVRMLKGGTLIAVKATRYVTKAKDKLWDGYSVTELQILSGGVFPKDSGNKTDSTYGIV